MACRLCVIYVREDNDIQCIGYNYMACMNYMVSVVPKRPLNLITHLPPFTSRCWEAIAKFN